MASAFVFLLVFCALLGAYLWMPSVRTRWLDLSDHYLDVTEGVPIREHSFFYQACEMGTARIALVVEIRRGGLYLQMPWPQRIVGQPVLIPWDKIRLVYVSEGGWLGRGHIELAVEHYDAPILIPGEAGRETAEWIKQVQGLTGPGPNYYFRQGEVPAVAEKSAQ
jgi:hypothetical protein